MFSGIEHSALNLLAGLLLGAAVHFERQWRQRLAGRRANALVALGAATFVMFAALFPGEASPTRVAAQVVSGIGFLGVDLIFKEGLSVQGLNTAATFWCPAAIGLLSGAGFFAHALLAHRFGYRHQLVAEAGHDLVQSETAGRSCGGGSGLWRQRGLSRRG